MANTLLLTSSCPIRSDQRFQRGGWALALHQRLADQESIDAAGLQALDVGTVVDAAFGHHHSIFGHQARQRLAGLETRDETMQIAIVDAENIAGYSQRSIQLRPIVH